MELKSKLDLPEGEIAVPSGTAARRGRWRLRADVRTALEGLGYGADEIHAVLVDLPAEGDVGAARMRFVGCLGVRSRARRH